MERIDLLLLLAIVHYYVTVGLLVARTEPLRAPDRAEEEAVLPSDTATKEHFGRRCNAVASCAEVGL